MHQHHKYEIVFGVTPELAGWLNRVLTLWEKIVANAAQMEKLSEATAILGERTTGVSDALANAPPMP